MSAAAPLLNLPGGHNTRLREFANEIGTDRVLAWQAWSTWDLIAENAERINASRRAAALAHIQSMALSETIMTFGRIYDNNKHESVASIKYAIKEISAAKLINRYKFGDYLVRLGFSKNIDTLSDDELLSFGEAFIEKIRPTDNSDERLSRMMTIWHQRIAHRARSKDELGFYEADVKFCYDWVTRFLTMLSGSFNVGMVEAGPQSPTASLRNLCRDAGIMDFRRESIG